MFQCFSRSSLRSMVKEDDDEAISSPGSTHHGKSNFSSNSWRLSQKSFGSRASPRRGGANAHTPPPSVASDVGEMGDPVMERTRSALTDLEAVKFLIEDWSVKRWRPATPQDQVAFERLEQSDIKPLVALGEGAYGSVNLCRIAVPSTSSPLSHNAGSAPILGSLPRAVSANGMAVGGHGAMVVVGDSGTLGPGGSGAGGLHRSSTSGVLGPQHQHHHQRNSSIGRSVLSRMSAGAGGAPDRSIGRTSSSGVSASMGGTPPFSPMGGELRIDEDDAVVLPEEEVPGGSSPTGPGPSHRAMGGTPGLGMPGPSGSSGSSSSTAPGSGAASSSDRGRGAADPSDPDPGAGTSGGDSSGSGSDYPPSGERPEGGEGQGPGEAQGPPLDQLIVAVKRVPLGWNQERELMQLHRCQACPFIVRLFGFVDDGSEHCSYVMEWAEGGDLAAMLASLKDRRGANKQRLLMSEASARYYAACLLLALEFLHARGLLHRDIKPGNLLLTSDGTAKLADLGFTVAMDANGTTVGCCGTTGYIAPEVYAYGSSKGKKGYGVPADIWSAGATLYQILTGAVVTDKPEEVLQKGWRPPTHPRFSQALQDLLNRMLAAKPHHRPQSVASLMCHPWFVGFDWAGLRAGTLKAPYVPAERRTASAASAALSSSSTNFAGLAGRSTSGSGMAEAAAPEAASGPPPASSVGQRLETVLERPASSSLLSGEGEPTAPQRSSVSIHGEDSVRRGQEGLVREGQSFETALSTVPKCEAAAAARQQAQCAAEQQAAQAAAGGAAAVTAGPGGDVHVHGTAGVPHGSALRGGHAHAHGQKGQGHGGASHHHPSSHVHFDLGVEVQEAVGAPDGKHILLGVAKCA